MSSGSQRPNRVRWGTLIVGIWLAVGLLTTQFTYLALTRTGAKVSWTLLLTNNLVSVLLWAAFTPGMVWVAWREPFWRAPRHRQALIHFLAFLAFAAADVLFERVLSGVLPLIEIRNFGVVTVFLRRLFPNFLCYLSVVAIATIFGYAAQVQESANAAVRLASQLTAARLQMLQAQLRPHFLFNTLNMIAEQVHVSPANADRMIGRLGVLLRASLSSADQQQVTLAQEMTLLQAYLDIMDVRLSNRIRYSVSLENGAEDGLVPTFLLQPLVENAIRHGLEPLRRESRLEVLGRRRGVTLEIDIVDNGTGFDVATYREGVGLRNVRERLHEMYGERASFTLESRFGNGVVARLRLPYVAGQSTNGTAPHELAEQIA